MAPKTKEKSLRVGFLVTVAAVIFMVGLFFIGSEQKIFARKQEYTVRLDNVIGLAQGNPVKISGVTVGVIRDIHLPRDPKQKDVDITLMVDKKYADLIRTDSLARLKKLSLLAGDSYIEISRGSANPDGKPKFDARKAGENIPAAPQTKLDQLISSSGESLVDKFERISHSLVNILDRVERGEGLLGEMTQAPATKQRITDTFLTTLNKTNAILSHVESGRGTIGRLVYDDQYGEELTGSLAQAAKSLQAVTTNVQSSFEKGEGMLPALLHDPQGKKAVYDLVENLRTTSGNLATFTTSMQSGQGLLPRLMNDKAYADQSLAEFTGLVRQLNEAVSKINTGNGTAGKLINDPAVYESINDILIGINESKMLRWLIRNRQEKGIEKRYDAGVQQPAPPPPPPPATNKGEAAPPDVPVTPVTTTTTAVTTTQPPM